MSCENCKALTAEVERLKGEARDERNKRWHAEAELRRFTAALRQIGGLTIPPPVKDADIREQKIANTLCTAIIIARETMAKEEALREVPAQGQGQPEAEQ